MRRESVAGEATNHLNQRGAEAGKNYCDDNDSGGGLLPYVTPQLSSIVSSKVRILGCQKRACRFHFCFLDIRIRTIQLKHEGWGVFFWTTASQDNFVGFNPLTILSGQGHTSEHIAQHSHFSDDRSS